MLQVREVEDRQFRVLVAYGTSRKLDALRTGEFAVRRQDGTAIRLAGLETDTKLSLQAAVELDYSDEWFKPPPLQPHGASPKPGEPHASLVQRAAAAWVALNN